MRAEPQVDQDVLPEFDLGQLANVPVRDYLVRFALGAAISVAAALIANATSARFGGLFLAFPAILPAALTLTQDEQGTRAADRGALGAILGGVSLVVFAVVAEAALAILPAAAALTLALGGWILTALGCYGLLALVAPQTCDKRRDHG
ncbi:MAG: DUF3147 family protein [Actinomycetota bacterium]|nr:DUF3147 family protein [Actinomycetota bacterium]